MEYKAKNYSFSASHEYSPFSSFLPNFNTFRHLCQAVRVETVAADSNEKEEPKEALSTKNSQLPISQLELIIKPLTKDQIQVEADAWFDLLREKVQEISDTEILIQTQEDSGQIGGAVDTDKEKLVVKVTKLKTEQSNLVNRLGTVLDSLEDKGGDPEAYRQYVGAVGGIDFDLGIRENLSYVLGLGLSLQKVAFLWV